MEFKKLVRDRLQKFCDENDETVVADVCGTDEGFDEIVERVELLLENDFKGQEITIEEVISWIEANDYEND